MNAPEPDRALEKRLSNRLLDVLIRAGLVLALAMLCYKIFAPFLTLMVWALILSVTLYPLHQILATRFGGKQGLAATLVVMVGILLIVVPTAIVINSLSDSVQNLINNAQNDTLHIPAPPPGVAEWPIVGKKVSAFWTQAHSDFPALVKTMQPKIGELATQALSMVASAGGAMLLFLVSFIIAGIIMAFGESGAKAAEAIFQRIGGIERGSEFAVLSTATIRAVASGVIGIAFIQAILVGLALIIAGIPWAGVLSLLVMVLGIAQIPALLVTLPAIGYLFSSGDYSTAAAIGYSAVLFVSGMADNVLKPLLLGRGVDAPMPVILLGALGGMATSGVLGMFVGATLLAVGYQIFMGWVANNPDTPQQPAVKDSQTPA